MRRSLASARDDKKETLGMFYGKTWLKKLLPYDFYEWNI